MNTKKDKKTIEGATSKEIEAALIERFGKEKVEQFKKDYSPRKIGVIAVDGKFAVLRPVCASEVAQYSMMVAGERGLDKAAQYLISELWIDGDWEILEDEELFISAMMQINRLIELKKSVFCRL